MRCNGSSSRCGSKETSCARKANGWPWATWRPRDGCTRFFCYLGYIWEREFRKPLRGRQGSCSLGRQLRHGGHGAGAGCLGMQTCRLGKKPTCDQRAIEPRASVSQHFPQNDLSHPATGRADQPWLGRRAAAARAGKAEGPGNDGATAIQRAKKGESTLDLATHAQPRLCGSVPQGHPRWACRWRRLQGHVRQPNVAGQLYAGAPGCAR